MSAYPGLPGASCQVVHHPPRSSHPHGQRVALVRPCEAGALHIRGCGPCRRAAEAGARLRAWAAWPCPSRFGVLRRPATAPCLPRPGKSEPGQRAASSIPPIFIVCEYPMRQRRFPLTAFTRRSRVSCRCSKRGFPERPRKGSLQPPRRDCSRAPRTSRPASRIRGARALPPNTPFFRLVYDHLQLHASILTIPAPHQAAGA